MRDKKASVLQMLFIAMINLAKDYTVLSTFNLISLKTSEAK